eukprot:CAMPEP_0194576260 /NCGR_PEP_ID=MMETSP0292-20121207/11440_1 /TAXON_ID=39354 /ORGANISM="Heterosigma akashiwo, Strain CCMP2393" /LENGTH=55 /DNA_ID=CAMNT_0039428261 /DNA_START=474 /DNA_END=641 /DNA_ORIENTATION=-
MTRNGNEFKTHEVFLVWKACAPANSKLLTLPQIAWPVIRPACNPVDHEVVLPMGK